MKSRIVRWSMALLLFAAAIVVQATPTIPAGYTVELYASGIGAANALALDAGGYLYITDYLNGQLLRRNASGGVDVVASGIPNSNGLAITASGRIFVTGNSCCVYEILGGTPQLVSSIFPYPSSLAAKGDDVYVSYEGGISKIATLTGTITTVLTSIGNPFGLSFDALGNLYIIDHGPGALYTYNFVDAPRLLTQINPGSGTYTGFGFNGQLFWGDYRLGTLFRLSSASTPEVFATGFGPSVPPVNGPNGIIAQGSNAILVADAHYVWRIALTPPSIAELLAQLADEVVGVGPGTSLVNQVTLAQTYYSVNDIPATCAVLTGVRQLVMAQISKKIQPDLATKLISDDAKIQTELSCPY